MRPVVALLVVALVSFVLVVASVLPMPAVASVTACTASITPTIITQETTADFTLTIQNTDSVAYSWIKITRPSTNWTINSLSVNGWGTSTNSADSMLTGGSLAAGSSLHTTINVSSGSADVPAEDWVVEVSDDAGGASPFSCTGMLSTSISGTAPDTTPPTISNAQVVDVTNTSVRVAWDTDEAADSIVNYGTTDEYGSTVTEGSFVTSHEVVLTGLAADTLYHYQFGSTDADGNGVMSEDATFMTAQDPVVALAALMGDVQQVQHRGVARSLLTDLEVAQRAMLRGRNDTAVRKLGSFIAEVMSSREDKLAGEDTHAFIQQAIVLIVVLSL